MPVTENIKLFHKGAERRNGILMFLVAETIISKEKGKVDLVL